MKTQKASQKRLKGLEAKIAAMEEEEDEEEVEEGTLAGPMGKALESLALSLPPETTEEEMGPEAAQLYR